MVTTRIDTNISGTIGRLLCPSAKVLLRPSEEMPTKEVPHVEGAPIIAKDDLALAKLQ